MYLAFHTDLTGVYVLFAIIVALLVANVCALIWRLKNKLRPKLTDKSKSDLSRAQNKF